MPAGIILFVALLLIRDYLNEKGAFDSIAQKLKLLYRAHFRKRARANIIWNKKELAATFKKALNVSNEQAERLAEQTLKPLPKNNKQQKISHEQSKK